MTGERRDVGNNDIDLPAGHGLQASRVKLGMSDLLPDGQIKRKVCPVLARKICRLCRRANQWSPLRASRPDQEGRFAIVTNVGSGCDGRVGAARRAASSRTAKSCGPDVSTLISSRRNASRGDGGKKARSPERARSKPLKPIAQEKPDRFGGPVVTNSCLLFFDTRLRVRLSIRLFLRPLFLRDVTAVQPGQIRPRECGRVA